MSREVKFRALVDGEIIYQSKTHSFNIGGAHGDECLAWLGFDLIGSKKIKVLMQYTGLKDKNGFEIYEGDILLVVEDGDVENSIKHEVQFNPVCGGYIIDTPNNCDGDMTTIPWAEESCYFEYEVIGNIYENPELLGGNDE